MRVGDGDREGRLGRRAAGAAVAGESAGGRFVVARGSGLGELPLAAAARACFFLAATGLLADARFAPEAQTWPRNQVAERQRQRRKSRGGVRCQTFRGAEADHSVNAAARSVLRPLYAIWGPKVQVIFGLSGVFAGRTVHVLPAESKAEWLRY